MNISQNLNANSQLSHFQCFVCIVTCFYQFLSIMLIWIETILSLVLNVNYTNLDNTQKKINKKDA